SAETYSLEAVEFLTHLGTLSRALARIRKPRSSYRSTSGWRDSCERHRTCSALAVLSCMGVSRSEIHTPNASHADSTVRRNAAAGIRTVNVNWFVREN